MEINFHCTHIFFHLLCVNFCVFVQVNPPRCPRVHHSATPPRPSSPPPNSPAQTASKSHSKGQAQRRTSHSSHNIEDMNMANSGIAVNGSGEVTPLINPDSHGNYIQIFPLQGMFVHAISLRPPVLV